MKLLWVLLLVPWVQAQEFDVISLKVHKGDVNITDLKLRGRTVESSATTVLDYIAWAYGVRSERVSGGPAWTANEHYDLLAKSEGDGVLPGFAARKMMQSLLASRFQLTCHRETQEVPIYNLVVAKNGPKLQPVPADTVGSMRTSGGSDGLHIAASKATMKQLADQLMNTAGAPVYDKTGLTDLYAFKLDWFPSSMMPPPGSGAPSMFEALQAQLGLRLEASKVPVEKTVIDHIEKPAEN